jgi:hypothetical protein
MNTRIFSPRTETGRARSSLTMIGAVLGGMLGSAAIVPLQGHSVVGPWMIMFLGFLVGGLIGALVAPFASGLFRRRNHYQAHRLSNMDPVSGRSLRSNRDPAPRVV